MFSITKISNDMNGQVVEYTCDVEADVQDLPKNVMPGSSAFVIEGPKVFMLGNDREWHEI